MTDVFVTHRDPNGNAHCLEFGYDGEVTGAKLAHAVEMVPDENAVLDVTMIRS